MFCDDAIFSGTNFCDSAEFGRAEFNGLAHFSGLTFAGGAHSVSSHFKGHAEFHALRSERAFTLEKTTFERLPDFNQAHFDEAPRLDFLRIEPKRFENRWKHGVKPFFKRNFGSDPDRAAKWRSLKRLAIQAHDHARELEFFREEVIARRLVEDKWHHPTLWAGLLYQAFSDFGRSILRPLGWGAMLALLFGWIYLDAYAPPKETQTGSAWLWQRTLAMTGHPKAPASLACNGKRAGKPWQAALQLSIAKAIPLPGISSRDHLRQIHTCLYGTRNGGAASDVTRTEPVIPATIAFFGYLQTVLSTGLLFLFLLALRNHFRIR